MKNKLTQYRVIRDYESPYPAPILFQRSERVVTGSEFTDDPDWKNWLWCTGSRGQQAWVPRQFLEIQGTSAIFRRDYNALELSMYTGEVILVGEQINGFGMAEKVGGEKGWVPMRNLLQFSADEQPG